MPPLTAWPTRRSDSLNTAGRRPGKAETKADPDGPFLAVQVDDRVVVKEHLVKPVASRGRLKSPYRALTTDRFTATAPEHTLTFRARGGGEKPSARTILIDDVRILDWDIDRDEWISEDTPAPAGEKEPSP